MKVLCVNSRTSSNLEKIEDGVIYTAIKSGSYFSDKFQRIIHYYQLAETGDNYWEKIFFIPCSDIDETELIKERETQHA